MIVSKQRMFEVSERFPRPAQDTDGLYDLIRDDIHEGRLQGLTMEELVRGMGRLKGTARSYDMQLLLRQVASLMNHVERLNRGVLAGKHAEPLPLLHAEDVGKEGQARQLMQGVAWR